MGLGWGVGGVGGGSGGARVLLLLARGRVVRPWRGSFVGAEVERRQAKPRRPLRGHWLHRRDFFCTCHLTEGNWKATAPVRSISSRLLPPGCFLQVRSHGMRWGWCGEIEWVKMDDRAQGGFLKPCYTTNDRLPGSNSSSQVVVWLAVCWRSRPELALSPRGPRSCLQPIRRAAL